MSRPTAKKIHPFKLRKVAGLLFNRESLSGGDLARRLGQNYYAVRKRVMIDGCTPTQARDIAKVLDDWSAEIKASAARLRSMAKEVD